MYKLFTTAHELEIVNGRLFQLEREHFIADFELGIATFMSEPTEQLNKDVAMYARRAATSTTCSTQTTARTIHRQTHRLSPSSPVAPGR